MALTDIWPSRMVWLVGSCLIWSPASPARAWTEAEVRGVSAEVLFDAQADASIALTIGLQVRRGWLEGFEVSGLQTEDALDAENALELDEAALRFVSEEGEEFAPTVRVRADGRVQLGFTRRAAPRRGRYTVHLRYRSSLAASAQLIDDEVHFLWTLPGWRSGLDGVSIAVTGPDGLDFSEASDLSDAVIEQDREPAEHGGSRLVWRRAHLPRTVPWTVAFRVPRAAMRLDATSLSHVAGHGTVDALPEAASLGATRTPQTPWFMALLLWVFVVAALFTYERRCHSLGILPRGVIPLPAWARALFASALAAGAMLLAEQSSVWLGLLVLCGLCSLERAPVRNRPLRVGGWRVMNASDRRKARHRAYVERFLLVEVANPIALAGLLGATSALSLVYRSDVNGGAALEYVLAGWLVLFMPLLSGGRGVLPESAAAQYQRLIRQTLVKPRLRNPGLANSVPTSHRQADRAMGVACLHTDVLGRWQDVRLRFSDDIGVPGVIRLDLAVLSSDSFASAELRVGGEVKGVIVTRAGSPAEVLAANLLPDVPVVAGPGGCRGRCVAPQQFVDLRTAFDEAAAEEDDTVESSLPLELAVA